MKAALLFLLHNSILFPLQGSPTCWLNDLKRPIISFMLHLCFFLQWPVKMATDVFVRFDKISTDVQTWLTLKVLFTWRQCKWNGSVAGGRSTCHMLLHSKVKWYFFMFSSLRCLFKWQSGVSAVLGLTITLFLRTFDSPLSISFTSSLPRSLFFIEYYMQNDLQSWTQTLVNR